MRPFSKPRARRPTFRPGAEVSEAEVGLQAGASMGAGVRLIACAFLPAHRPTRLRKTHPRTTRRLARQKGKAMHRLRIPSDPWSDQRVPKRNRQSLRCQERCSITSGLDVQRSSCGSLGEMSRCAGCLCLWGRQRNGLATMRMSSAAALLLLGCEVVSRRKTSRRDAQLGVDDALRWTGHERRSNNGRQSLMRSLGGPNRTVQ